MLNKEQQAAINAIKKGRNIFITGSAGTGKSYLVDHIRKTFNNVAVTASTGVSAIGIEGRTFHRFSGLIPKSDDIRKMLNYLGDDRQAMICETDILIVDEISMLSAETLETADTLLKEVRCDEKAFGGMQLVFIGDFLQLAPVEGEYCFTSPLWHQMDFQTIKLHEVMRQKDQEFAGLLEKMRDSSLKADDFAKFRKCMAYRDIKDYVHLFATNAECAAYNKKKYEELTSEQECYVAWHTGDEWEAKTFIKGSLIEENLILRAGARVMMLANDFIVSGVANGSMGYVNHVGPDYVGVKFDNGADLGIKTKEFKITDHLGEIIATVHQVPLRLSWGITIHKSQGMTLEKVACDFRRVFAPSHGYVALSRAKSIEGLYIMNTNARMWHVNRQAADFMNKIK